MRSCLLLIFAALAFASAGMAASAQEVNNGKNCRMEQQCHWENFKKVCVTVKVCR